MKVLLISNYKKGTGGISGQVEILCKKLAQEGIESKIFNTKGSFAYRIGCFFRLIKTAHDYDVLHIHCCSGLGFLPAILGITAGKTAGKKIILTYHGGDAEAFFSKHTKLVKYVLGKTDINIVLSGYLFEIFQKFCIPCIIIPNVIEMDSSKFRERQNINPRFISTRTLSPLYNIECILKAYKIVRSKIPDATLKIVGDGPSRPYLEEIVKKEMIEGAAFVGRVDNNLIYEYLNDSDIFLSSPRIDNMPVSILEAFNAGLLVISSNVGGVPYMIEDHVNGILFPSGNHEQMAECMIWAVHNCEQSREMIQKAKSRLDAYSWPSVWNKLREFYGC